MPTEEQIRQLAHALWEDEGRPEGKDVDHYLTAKAILDEREAARGNARTPRPKASKSSGPRMHSSRAKKR